MTATTDKASLRRTARVLRAQLPDRDRRHFDKRIARSATRFAEGRAVGVVGSYVAAGSEVATTLLHALLRASAIGVAVPRLAGNRSGAMRFVELGGSMKRNRFGIAEPTSGRRFEVRGLALVFVPLLAFDSSGARLGQGGGHYDRALRWRTRQRWCRRPRIVGLAYDCQRVSTLPREPHDVCLDAVVTESGICRFQGG